MKAVILAGGKGQRLRPYTSVLPKPLMPIGDQPILEIILRQLHHHGVQEVVIALGYLGSLIQSFLEHSELSRMMRIRYHWEESPLGTAGAIGTIEGLGDEPCLVMNGDILTSLDYAAMIDAHRQAKAALSVGVVRTQVQIELGVLTIDAGGRITDYDEKPTMSYAASMGVYVYSPRARAQIKPGSYLDAPTLVTQLMAAGETVFAFDRPCAWIDMGNSGQHERACQAFAETPELYLPGDAGEGRR